MSGSPARPPSLSIVTPVRDEAAVLEELCRRIAAAARSTGLPFEHVVVDDASTDSTPGLLRALAGDLGDGGLGAEAGGGLRAIRLDPNRGQLGATRAGLAAARGDVVVVLDGDLQDPPETIPELVRALRSTGADVVFAVKRSRRDPFWFRAGRLGYRALARLGRAVPPSGAGSYVAMDLDLARRVSAVPPGDANLAPLLVALGARRFATVPYDKAERVDGRSRVGAVGLAREALGSLALTGALERVAILAAIPVLSLAVAVNPAWILAALPLAALFHAASSRRKALKAPLPAPM